MDRDWDVPLGYKLWDISNWYQHAAETSAGENAATTLSVNHWRIESRMRRGKDYSSFIKNVLEQPRQRTGITTTLIPTQQHRPFTKNPIAWDHQQRENAVLFVPLLPSTSNQRIHVTQELFLREDAE